MNPNAVAKPRPNRGGFLLLLLCLLAILSFLFFPSFNLDQALFANDGPYGVQMSLYLRPPGSFFGIWNDLYWLGAYNGNYSLNITGALLFLLRPRLFVNFYAPLTSLILGLCAWFFFRRLRFNTFTCVLAGLAAALNMNFFSNACWGLGTRGLCLGATFLALAAVTSSFRRFAVIKLILAGLAIGLSISEGGDNGGIFSLFVAAYAFFLTIIQEGPMPKKILWGVGRVILMAALAGLFAVQSLLVFQDVAVKGVAGVEQNDMSPQVKWDWATQWSLPKAETLRVIIPGLYGYRLDTPNGGNYWGTVGQQPGWTPENPVGFPRHSGSGEFAGVLVVLVVLWALANSFSRTAVTYDPKERKLIWFWGVMGLVALLLAWGRHAPFYRVLYVLPYFSTIRNPMKFMHPFHMTLMILFAYGLMGLSRRYLEKASAGTLSLGEHIKGWWAKAAKFEKRWLWGCLVLLGLSVLAYLIYNVSRGDLVAHLTRVGFDEPTAQQIARFSVGEVGMFIVFLAASVGALVMIQSGALGGRRARWAGVLLGVILVVDLVRADTPWIQYLNIKEKYATNPVLDVLRNQPYEYRVTVPNFQVPPQATQVQQLLMQVYQIEWLQHHFQLYNIQALEVAQMPRVPEDYAAFNRALSGKQLRLWQLTNTRYILALAGFTDAFNRQLDPQLKRFHTVLDFEITQRPGGGITAVTNTTGPYALIGFAGALPRAKLYAQWQVSTNDAATLKELGEPAFHPEQNVIVAEAIPAPEPTATNAMMAPVQIFDYSSRRIEMHCQATAPTVLLLNNRWDPELAGDHRRPLRAAAALQFRHARHASAGRHAHGGLPIQAVGQRFLADVRVRDLRVAPLRFCVDGGETTEDSDRPRTHASVRTRSTAIFDRGLRRVKLAPWVGQHRAHHFAVGSSRD